MGSTCAMLLTLTERPLVRGDQEAAGQDKEEVTRAASQVLHVHRGIKPAPRQRHEFPRLRPTRSNAPGALHFATPYHSWSAAANENMNGLIPPVAYPRAPACAT